MKTKPAILKFPIVFCITFATTAAFGALRTWTGGDGTGINLSAATNWSGSTLPGNGDTAQWDGTVGGNLSLTYNGGIGGNFETTACSYSLTTSQTGNVTITSPVSFSANLAVNHLTNNSPAGALTFGDGTANVLYIIWRADSGIAPYTPHTLINNSAGAVVICPNVKFQAGGGNPHTLIFSGSGDWRITNNLVCVASTAIFIQKNGSGTMFWNGPSISAAMGNSVIASPIDIEGGTLVLQNNTVLGSFGVGSNTGFQNITNNATFKYDASGLAQTLSGIIRGTGLLQVNSGTLTLSGANTYSGGTTISGGTLQVGAGGTNGSVGTGNITDNGVVVFNRSDNVTFTNVINGAGSVVQFGSGTLTFADVNTYTGPTTVSNGTLFINRTSASPTIVVGGTLGGNGVVSAPVTLFAGATLSPGASAGAIGTFTNNGDMNLGGNVAIDVNKSLAQSNDFVVVTGMLTNTGTGTLTVSNLGPALAVGDKFTPFSQPLQNGAALTVTGAGANWANNLAVDGSISVIAPPTLNFTKTGNSLQFSWTGSFKLQSQTNSLNAGLGTNWADFPGGGTNPVPLPIDVTEEAVFFRLVTP